MIIEFEGGPFGKGRLDIPEPTFDAPPRQIELHIRREDIDYPKAGKITYTLLHEGVTRYRLLGYSEQRDVWIYESANSR